MKRALLVIGSMAMMILLTAACPKKVKRPPQPPIPPPVETLPAMPPETPAKPPVTPPPEQGMTPTPGSALKTVHFDFDKFDIRTGDAKILGDDATFLRNNSGVKVSLEGYTDPVGTEEYNRGLGLRRANSVKAYLVKLGLDATRFSTVSFGEEKLVTTDSTQFEMNRRVEFVPKQ